MNSKGCQGTPGIASALLSGMGEIATSGLYEWIAGMWFSSFWSTRVLSFYHLSIKRIIQSCTCNTAHTQACMHIRVACGRGVAYGLRRIHIYIYISFACMRFIPHMFKIKVRAVRNTKGPGSRRSGPCACVCVCVCVLVCLHTYGPS